jgi:hypothetical protein
MKKALSIVMAGVLMMLVAMSAVAAEPTAISLGADSNGVNLDGALLTPGEEYRFPLNITLDDGTTRAFAESDLDSYSLRITNIAGADSLSSFKVSKIGGVYYLIVTVKAGWPVEQTVEEFAIKYVKKSNGNILSTIELEFDTGYATADDDYIASLAYGDYVQVDPDAPVFTEEQLDKIAKLNSYKKVTFTNGYWSYEVNVTDMGDINMLNNQNAIKDILLKYEENEFSFLTFPAGPQFGLNGTMTIDVSALADDFDAYYVYLYDGYKLTKIASTYNDYEYTLSFTASSLGRFVVTDKEIKDTVVVSGGSSSSGSGSGTKTNPSTGAK